MIHPPASWSCFQHISVSLDRSRPRYMRSHSLPTFGQLSHLSEKLAEREDVENGKICVTRIDHILSQQRSCWYQYKHSGRWFSSVAPSCAAETHARANPIRTCQGHAKRMLVEKWLVEVIMATMDCWVSPTFRKLEVGQKHHIIIPMIFPSRFVAPQQSVVDLTTIGPVLVRTCEFHPQNRHHHGPPGPRRFGWDIMGYHGNVMGILWNVMGMLWDMDPPNDQEAGQILSIEDLLHIGWINTQKATGGAPHQLRSHKLWMVIYPSWRCHFHVRPWFEGLKVWNMFQMAIEQEKLMIIHWFLQVSPIFPPFSGTAHLVPLSFWQAMGGGIGNLARRCHK